jgi:hypothetical protein
MVALQLDEGTYPLAIRYRQVAGPSSFVLGWNRPGVLELFPMGRFVGNEPEAIAPRALRGEHRRAVLLLVLGSVVVQIVVLSVTALIPGENSRVWLFLYPLVTLVGAFELSRWRPRAAMLAYAAQFLIFVTLYQNMAMGQ